MEHLRKSRAFPQIERQSRGLTDRFDCVIPVYLDETMEIKHRIAAGSIVIKNSRILLVRIKKGDQSYLVAPGGAINDGESLADAAVRETEEETAVRCVARKAIMLENIRASRYQMLKVWYLCDYLSGEPVVTGIAEKEDIIDVGWYTDEDLAGELVFPVIVKELKIAGLSNFDQPIIDQGIRFSDF